MYVHIGYTHRYTHIGYTHIGYTAHTGYTHIGYTAHVYTRAVLFAMQYAL
jgi:hypothetical protein